MFAQSALMAADPDKGASFSSAIDTPRRFSSVDVFCGRWFFIRPTRAAKLRFILVAHLSRAG